MGDGRFLFAVWPWIRFSVLMAALTCLWAYTLYFFRFKEGEERTYYGNIHAGYTLAFVPFNMLLAYPGSRALGIGSDSNFGILMLVLVIIHAFGFYFIQRGIQKYLEDIDPVFLL